MNAKIPALAALIAGMTFAAQARADTVSFGFWGGGFTGTGNLTVEPNVSPPDPNPNCGQAGQNPCRTDPAGAWRITGINGTFSDAADGISNAAITGLIPINPANERDPTFDPLVPASLSFVDYNPPSGFLSYNNLYFPNGSPIDCGTFPFTGTFVDDFGMAFTVAGGYTVNFWGDGDLHGPGTTTYGIAVVQENQQLAYVFDGLNAAAPVPEAPTWAMMLIGLGGLGYRLRHKRRLSETGAA